MRIVSRLAVSAAAFAPGPGKPPSTSAQPPAMANASSTSLTSPAGVHRRHLRPGVSGRLGGEARAGAPSPLRRAGRRALSIATPARPATSTASSRSSASNARPFLVDEREPTTTEPAVSGARIAAPIPISRSSRSCSSSTAIWRSETPSSSCASARAHHLRALPFIVAGEGDGRTNRRTWGRRAPQPGRGCDSRSSHSGSPVRASSRCASSAV